MSVLPYSRSPDKRSQPRTAATAGRCPRRRHPTLQGDHRGSGIAVLQEAAIVHASGNSSGTPRQILSGRSAIRPRQCAPKTGRGAGVAGIFATVLLVILFASEFFGLKYAYGAGLLFVLATVTLGLGLIDFFREARLGLVQADEFE